MNNARDLVCVCRCAALAAIVAVGATCVRAAERLPIFDAHLHYNAEATATLPVPAVLRELGANGVRTILATSRPNDGTRALVDASAAAGAALRVVPFIRPYRTEADRSTWFNDPAIYALIEAELARPIAWRGIGEFHVFGRDADTPWVRRIVALAVERGLWLHAHCDDAALVTLLGHDPRVRIIWAHTGFTTPPSTIARLFEQYPNVVGELSYRYDVTADGRLVPEWRALFERFAERFVVGSDTWVNGRWAQYGEIIEYYRGWLAQLPAAVAAKIAYGNGERIFAPEPPAPRTEEPFSRGLLFRVDRDGAKTSWVFGTIHSSDPRALALPAPVARAFAQARSFAPEIALTEADAGEFLELAQFDDGDALARHFDDESIAAIGRALGSSMPPAATFARLKPWAILLKLAQSPANDGATLDASLLAAAQARRMPVIGLEFAAEQASAFDAIPLETQVALVRYLLRERDALARDHREIVDAWLARDLARLASLRDAPARADPALAPHLRELSRHLIDNRSVTMAHRLFLPLRHGGVFVAVGALHLYGSRGLLALLREQGYRIRRVY
jgi:uncharacterized protein YbaP (TraB family)